MGEMEELNALCGDLAGDGKIQVPKKISRNDSPGPGSWEGFRASQSPSGVGLGDAFQFHQEDLACAVRLLRAPAAGTVRRMCGGAAPDRHGHSPGSKWSCLLLRIVL